MGWASDIEGDMAVGWSAHPDAEPPRQVPAAQLTDADRAAPVVRLGARCDLGPSRPDCTSARVTEYVELATGRIVVIRADRGFSVSGVRSTAPGETPAQAGSTDDIIRSVLLAVLPDEADDDDCYDEDDNYVGDPHGYDELAGLARAQGVEVTGDELRRLPYDVVLGGDVLARWGVS